MAIVCYTKAGENCAGKSGAWEMKLFTIGYGGARHPMFTDLSGEGGGSNLSWTFGLRPD